MTDCWKWGVFVNRERVGVYEAMDEDHAIRRWLSSWQRGLLDQASVDTRLAIAKRCGVEARPL